MQPASRRCSPPSPLLCDTQPALRAKRSRRYYGSVVLIRSHIFSQPSPSMAHLIYSRIASHTAPSVGKFNGLIEPGVGLDPVYSSAPLDWHIYILYSGIPYTCVIYLYTMFSLSPATPSCNCSRGMYLGVTFAGAVTPNSPRRILLYT